MIPYDDTFGYRETAMTVFIIGINVSVVILALGKLYFIKSFQHDVFIIQHYTYVDCFVGLHL